MKIIGGKRDYYDYLVGYYGYDDHIVYDRRNVSPIEIKSYTRLLFHVCGTKFPALLRDNKWIFDIDEAFPRDENGNRSYAIRDHDDYSFMRTNIGTASKVNEDMRTPLICSARAGYNFIPCLNDFGFTTVIPPDEMYQKIYSFLSWLKDNPIKPNNQTDKDKVQAHGFDKVTSFRPKIKI